LGDLNKGVEDKVNALIRDTLDYVHWTLEWPRFVQIVRSIRKGEFGGDLTWQPPSRAAVEAIGGGREGVPKC
jgi:hypothetical protein